MIAATVFWRKGETVPERHLSLLEPDGVVDGRPVHFVDRMAMVKCDYLPEVLDAWGLEFVGYSTSSWHYLYAEKEPSMDAEEIERRFTYHPTKSERGIDLVTIREDARRMARTIVRCTPSGREQALAITKLEEVVMWAYAAIEREGV